MRKVEVICNKCGKLGSEEVYYQDVHNIQLSFAYGSKFDVERWSFDLCDDCLEEIVKTFKHLPTGYGVDYCYGEDYE